jgi:hypothetical protein
MVVWSVADSLCHAGRLRIGFFDGFLLVERIDDGLGCSNLGVEPCRLEGGRAVLLGHQQGCARGCTPSSSRCRQRSLQPPLARAAAACLVAVATVGPHQGRDHGLLDLRARADDIAAVLTQEQGKT